MLVQFSLTWASPNNTKIIIFIFFYKLFESIRAITGGVETLVDNCVLDIEANEERCRDLVEHSVGIITAITPEVGYQAAADIAKEAIRTGKSVREVLKSKKIMSDEEADKLLDIGSMVANQVM